MALSSEFFKQHGFDILLLNHEGAEDKHLCEQIAEVIGESVEIADGLGAVEIKALLGRCQAVVSSRFHGCVSALSQGVPCLATSWSHKYEMLFEEYGLADNILDYLAKPDLVISMLVQFMKELDLQRKAGLSHAAQVKSDNRAMWHDVLTEINSYKRR